MTVGISTCLRIAWAQCDEYTYVNHIQIITTFKYATFLIVLVHVLQTGLNPHLNKPLQINPNITQPNNDKFCAAFRSGSCLLKFFFRSEQEGSTSADRSVAPKLPLGFELDRGGSDHTNRQISSRSTKSSTQPGSPIAEKCI